MLKPDRTSLSFGKVRKERRKDNENNEFYLEECCDNYFRHTLTKEECIKLSELFRDIANKF